jgi:cytochrome c peroxidase
MQLPLLMLLLAMAPGQQTEALRAPLGLDAYMPAPEDNPLTPEKAALGRKLFFDKRLSRDGTIACVSCHDPKLAFSDGRAVSEGVSGRRGTRNAPALVNRGYGSLQFWDGRAKSLEEQVLKPIQDPNEMDLTLPEAAARTGLAPEEMSRALASYVRSIRAGGSPFDRYMHGEAAALSPEQIQGLAVFRVKGNCIACHVGPNFTDEKFHNTGAAFAEGKFRDEGRALVTGRPEDTGAFRTPTLREIARTAPYMHDGGLATLEAVVDFYDQGGNRNPGIDSEIRPLRLTGPEKRALLAFLRALSGEIVEGAAGK